MATFEYNALTSAGRLMKGTIEAASRQEASELLGQMQLTVNMIEPARTEKPKTAIGRNEFLTRDEGAGYRRGVEVDAKAD
ncbi:MAG: hypothetical protein ACYS29_15890 [Planctomycetota bacterium]|jgi:type II secretory pathway component PulF